MKSSPFADTSTYVAFVGTSYMNIDMCKFEPSQVEERRAQLADSLKSSSKPRTVNCTFWPV